MMAADNEARSVLCDLALPSYIRLYKLILLEQQRKTRALQFHPKYICI